MITIRHYNYVGLGLVACLFLPSEALAVDGAAFEVVRTMHPTFSATASMGIKWGSIFGGTVLLATGLSKHSMKIAGYGLGLAIVPTALLALIVGGAACMLD